MRTTVSRVHVDAPREAVWAVLTEPEHVRAWQYGSELITDWSLGAPIRFVAQWQGQTFEQWGTVLGFEPQTRLSYSLFAPRPGLADLPENYFTMTYALTDDDGGTDVVITRDDPRPISDADDEAADDAENPVLAALKQRAESLPGRPAAGG